MTGEQDVIHLKAPDTDDALCGEEAPEKFTDDPDLTTCRNCWFSHVIPKGTRISGGSDIMGMEPPALAAQREASKVGRVGLGMIEDRQTGEQLKLSIEEKADGCWTLWVEAAGEQKSEPRCAWSLQPSEALEKLDERFEVNLFDLLDSGLLEEVAYQDWDSGGAGAGAGRVSVYQACRQYFVTHDAGCDGPYSSLDEAVTEGGINRVSDATVEIWRSDQK